MVWVQCLLLRRGQVPKVPVISIIDDDDSVRASVGCLVRSLGLQAHTFASAEEFLRSALVNDMSCLIVDVHMPGMRGLELQTLSLSQGRRTPVIFITAFPEKRIRSDAVALGAVGFLSKPFDGAALIECIDRALGRQRPKA